MVDFPTAVQAPGGASYNAPLLSFAAFQRWKPDDPYAQVFKQQEEQENAQKLQAMQRQNALAGAFPNGLPTDQNGQVDYRQLANILAAKGDIGGAAKVLASQPAPISPLFGGGPTSAQPAPNAAPAVSASPSSPAVNATAAKIIQNESGGNPNAKNPRSSAAGLGQFTDGTWIGAVKQYFPNLAKGRSDAQILKMRSIPQLATRVTEAFTAGNEAGLQKAGLPVTPATAYLAHFAGLEGATKVLRADPNTPVSQILGNAAIKANPFLKGMTARDLTLWAARKMQGPAMVAQQGQPGGNVEVADASANLPPSANAVSAAPRPRGSQGSGVAVAQAPVQQGAAPAQQPAPMMQPGAQPMQPPQVPTGAGLPAQPGGPQPQMQPHPPQQPLVPQEPLPPGYTDPVEAAHALRMFAATEAADPRPGAAQQAAAAVAWANRIDAGIKPLQVRPGETLLNPRTGQKIAGADQWKYGRVGTDNRGQAVYGWTNSDTRQVIPAGPGGGEHASGSNSALHDLGISDAQADTFSRYYMQTGKFPNLGFAQQANAAKLAITAMAADKAAEAVQQARQAIGEKPLPPGEQLDQAAAKYMADQQAAYAGTMSGARALGGRAVNIRLAANLATTAIPEALKQSEAFPRGRFTPINALKLKAYAAGSNVTLSRWDVANLQIAEMYARALNPQGHTIRQDMMERAVNLLSQAKSPQAYRATLHEIYQNMQREEGAIHTTEGQQTGYEPAIADPFAASKQNVTPSGVSWSIVK